MANIGRDNMDVREHSIKSYYTTFTLVLSLSIRDRESVTVMLVYLNLTFLLLPNNVLDLIPVDPTVPLMASDMVFLANLAPANLSRVDFESDTEQLQARFFFDVVGRSQR